MAPSRTALVTGGSSGLGYHVAKCLAERGYRVTIVGRDAERLAAAAKQLSGASHRSMALDLSVEDNVRELVRVVDGGGFDVLVNNAGAASFGPVSERTADTLKGDLCLNLLAPVWLSWAFARAARPGSVLVNVTSIVGRVPMPGNAVYSAAKSGLQVFTECLWYETRSKGIRVLDFRPVSLRTGFHRAAGARSMSPASMGAPPGVAARDLVDALESGRGFLYSYGISSRLLDLAHRLLPRRLLILLMGRKSRTMGYL